MKVMTDDDHAKLINMLEVAREAMEQVPGLIEKADAVAKLLLDAEVNHGGLIGTKTLTAANELRLELSRWK